MASSHQCQSSSSLKRRIGWSAMRVRTSARQALGIDIIELVGGDQAVADGRARRPPQFDPLNSHALPYAHFILPHVGIAELGPKQYVNLGKM